MKTTRSLLLAAFAAIVQGNAGAQLYENLQAFSARLDAGDPAVTAEGLNEGPKSIVTADFNRDGKPDLAISNLDGTVTYYQGGDQGEFSEPVHLHTGARSLREVVAADLNQDRQTDLAVAAPFDGKVFLFLNQGDGRFSEPQVIDTWIGARNLAAGDFDGDGVKDLAVAGPQKGLRHYRGLGDGTFAIAGDLPSLDPVKLSFPKPVYVMKTVASADGLRDDLVVSHADSSRTWILSSQPEPNEADKLFDGADGTQQTLPFAVDPELPLLITEFSASNDAVIPDEDGEFSDWIEIFNRTLQPVSLNDWGLSDAANNAEARWKFPEVTLQPGRFLLVFASGKDRRDPANNLHTNFKLSSRGEMLTLHRPNGERQLFPPPGAPQSRIENNSPLAIVEYGFAEQQALPDEQGNYFDWVRIANTSAESIEGSMWHLRLTTTFGFSQAFPRPDSTLAPGETLTVFLSGRNRFNDNGDLHTGFADRLQGNTLSVMLTEQDDHFLHSLDWTDVNLSFPQQISDISYGINQRGDFQFFDHPTPGWINSEGVRELGELPSRSAADVAITTDVDGSSTVRVELLTIDPLQPIIYVWFCYDDAAGVERHVLLRQMVIDRNRLNEYSAFLPPGYEDGTGYRIMAAAWDLSNDGKDITLQLATGGDRSNANVPQQPGSLKIAAVIPGQSARALDVGAILLPASEGVMDLITANRDTGNLEIRQGTARTGKFTHHATHLVRVPGGPRSVKIVDLNADGWNDVVVALRNFDRMVVFENDNGTLKLSSEVPTGVSPREVAVADFNGDGQPDAATINRLSSDVSIVPAHPGTASFTKLDQVYDTDGEVAGLTVIDVDGDGRDDVVQLHRASGDVSIRTAGATGRLSEPEFIRIGDKPSAFELIDVNADQKLDLVTVNLDEIGSISVRLRSDTGYGPEKRFSLPDAQRGSLFALNTADFDGDGITDLAAGYFDCRLALFRGTGDGGFEYVRSTRFTYESRVMTTGDFDNDGDIDIAGAGYAGDVVVFENRGNLLTDIGTPRWDYEAASKDKFGTREIFSKDFNGDGDLDLAIGSGGGLLIYRGLPGMLFDPDPREVEGTNYPTAGATAGDFDGDGVSDIAVSCSLLSCVSVLQGDDKGGFKLSFVVDVPAGDYLASGDLDGDGLADLIGAGDVLWTALSSRRSVPVPSVPENTKRISQSSVVINEILAINDNIPLEADDNKKTDWVELLNNTGVPVTLDGWQLTLDADNAGQPETHAFTLPTGITLDAGERQLVFFSPNQRSPLHTGRRLPGSGGTLTLTDTAGTKIDVVTYPDQQPNVAYGRYQDGAESFVFNPIPSPLGANSFDGSPDPIIDFKGFDFASLRPGQPIQFFVKGEDDLGILGITVVYQRLDLPGSPPGQFLLFDDGEHGDGAMLDGLFAGTMDEGLPSTGELQFYFVAEDLSGNKIEIPDETVFVNAGQTVRTFSVGFAGAAGPATLEISEISADNRTGLEDEAGSAADYVVIRNTSSKTVALAGMSLAKDFHADANDAFVFPPGATLEPGETFTIFADANTKQGSRHAPFRINRGGERLFLIGTAALGSRVLIDHVETPAVEEDRILTKIADTGLWASTLPTDRRPGELSELWQGRAYSAAGEALAVVAFQTEQDIEYVVEFSATGEDWAEVERIAGDGDVAVSIQGGAAGMFRLTEVRPPVTVPDIHHVAVTAGKTNAVVSGVLASDGGESADVQLYAGATDGGTVPAEWTFAKAAEIAGDGLGFHVEFVDFQPGETYFARASARNSAGEVWSAPVTFATLPANAPELFEIGISNFESDGFRVSGKTALADAVTIFFGTADGMEVPGAWQGETEATLADGVFLAEIAGLEQGRDYIVRVRARNGDFTSWSPSPFMASTLTESENLKHNLLISEIMYHPAGVSPFNESDMEYIELYNASRSPIDLSGLRFVSGITFDFANAGITELAPGQYAVIVANRNAFNDRYAGLNVTVLGEWLTPFRQSKLANSGETLTLQFGKTGDAIHAITYDDREPWPFEPDGNGASLTLASVEPGQHLNTADAWIASHSLLGTPGLKAVFEPLVLSQPQSATIEEGGQYVLSATVVGKPPMEGQWFRNGQRFEQAFVVNGNTVQLLLTNLLQEQGGDFTLVTSNEFGSIETETATVTVIPRSTDPGSVDVRFAPPLTGGATQLIPLPGGKTLAVGNMFTEGGSIAVSRLNSNGIPDASFHVPSVTRGIVLAATLMPDGRIALAGTFTRIDGRNVQGVAVLKHDGTVDDSFNTDFSIRGVPSDIHAQMDGSLVVVGSFQAISQVRSHQNIIKILPDGRLDVAFMNSLTPLISMTDSWRYHDQGETFGPEWRTAGFFDVNQWPEGPALLYVEQAELDGPTNTEITLTRGATTYYFRREMWNPFDAAITVDLLLTTYYDDAIIAYINGEEILRRRLPEGAITPHTPASPKVVNAKAEGPFLIPRVRLKPGYNVVAAEVHQESPQSSDVVFGLELKTPAAPGAAASLQTGSDGGIAHIAAAADGKMIIAGSFNSVGGVVLRGLARLRADGWVDTSFRATLPFSSIFDIEIQPDNKVLVAGEIAGRPGLFRLLPDGSPDPDFNIPQALPVTEIALAPDGAIYVALARNASSILRLHPDGNVDEAFTADPTNGFVHEILASADGKITFAGSFSIVDTVVRQGFGRIFAEPIPEGSIVLQTSSNLADWSTDTGAVIDIHRESIHATPVAIEGQLYFRLQGVDGVHIQPARIENDSLFFELHTK